MMKRMLDFLATVAVVSFYLCGIGFITYWLLTLFFRLLTLFFRLLDWLFQ